MMSETIFPTPRWGFLSAAFQRRSLSSGFSAIDMDRCFSSCPRGLVFAIVTFSRSQRGRGLPIPYGRNRSIDTKVLTEISWWGRAHSILRIFFGRLATSWALEIACHIASLKAGIRSVSIVNPAAWRCPPYLTKKCLHSSRSSIRLHHSGARQDPMESSFHSFTFAVVSIATVSHFRLVSGWSCPFFITILGLL